MSEASTNHVAVISERHGPGADRIVSLLRSLGLESRARWFRPRDVDDVERAVRDGRVREVVFDAPADLMRAAWERRAAPGTWIESGVRVHFARPATDEASLVRDLLDAWSRWDRARQRRNAAAGLVLTTVAMVLAFALTHLADALG